MLKIAIYNKQPKNSGATHERKMILCHHIMMNLQRLGIANFIIKIILEQKSKRRSEGLNARRMQKNGSAHFYLKVRQAYL